MSIAKETEPAETPGRSMGTEGRCGERLRNRGALVTAPLLVAMVVLIPALDDRHGHDRRCHADFDPRALHKVERLLIRSRSLLD